ncbi:MAG: type II toxin-antitoxin system PrlF family antitoxin [Deltaproteobacteria bacterium]|nr:type II toxin-antitoxin system PrlF family antitoxin [Deltaproteobacteria bacterium]
MPVSSLTSKWQTTIPKEIRNFLGLKPTDKIFYVVDGNKVILKPLKGNILDLRGSVKTKGEPVDFDKVRATTRKRIARKIVENTR